MPAALEVLEALEGANPPRAEELPGRASPLLLLVPPPPLLPMLARPALQNNQTRC